MNQPSFAVIGGDLRQVVAANALASDGYPVCCYLTEKNGISALVRQVNSLEEAMEDTDVVVLPLPVSTDDKTVRNQQSLLPFEELFQYHTPLFLGGKAGPNLLHCANSMNCRFEDYFLREELNVLNAIPTAEGAIAIAMEELSRTLHGSRCLVLGFGRIGKVLAHQLRGLGAKVTCGARKPADLAWIEAYGYDSLHIQKLSGKLCQYDVIFNTAPALILSKDNLKQTKPEVVLIDLASKPGGIDFTGAKELNRTAIWALSLPGKVAPLTAGLIIKDTILHLLQEQNMIE